MNKLYFLLLPLIVISCSKEISDDRLVERNGLYYEINSENPYTGYVKNYHRNGQKSFEGYFKDGQKQGVHNLYDSNGYLIQSIIFQGDNFFSEKFHKNGELSSQISGDSTQIKTYIEIVYDETGKIIHCKTFGLPNLNHNYCKKILKKERETFKNT